MLYVHSRYSSLIRTAGCKTCISRYSTYEYGRYSRRWSRDVIPYSWMYITTSSFEGCVRYGTYRGIPPIYTAGIPDAGHLGNFGTTHQYFRYRYRLSQRYQTLRLVGTTSILLPDPQYVRYIVNTATGQFGKFGTASIPVPDNSVRLVHQYRNRTLWLVRYNIDTSNSIGMITLETSDLRPSYKKQSYFYHPHENQVNFIPTLKSSQVRSHHWNQVNFDPQSNITSILMPRHQSSGNFDPDS